MKFVRNSGCIFVFFNENRCQNISVLDIFKFILLTSWKASEGSGRCHCILLVVGSQTVTVD